MINDSDSHRTSVPSPWRRIFCSLFLVAAAVALVAAVASSPAVGQRVERLRNARSILRLRKKSRRG